LTFFEFVQYVILLSLQRKLSMHCLQTVTEEKFSILFQSQFSVGGGELVFQVWVSHVMVFSSSRLASVLLF